jgi:uncharacterized protein (DUF433 family)
VNALVAEMVTEAIKLRHVPTIHFEDGATGRRACVPGTSIPIWGIIEFYEYVGRDFEELKRSFDWIKRHQLEAALAYYDAFPEDIKPRLKTEEEAVADLHKLWAQYPQTSPDWPGRRGTHIPAGSTHGNPSDQV